MEKLTGYVTKFLSVTLIILMAVMVLDVTWQIFTRFIMKDPSSFTEELAGFLLVWIGLLGSSYALYTKAHLGIDILTMRLRGVRKQAVEIIVYLVIFLFSLFVLVVGGLKLMILALTLNQISPSLGIPIGYIYIVLPLTGILMMFYSVYFMMKVLKKEELTEVAKSVSAAD